MPGSFWRGNFISSWRPALIMEIQKSVQSTFNKHRESVVIVRVSGATPKETNVGSGFIIRSEKTHCLVMTCYHVIENFVAYKHILCVRFAGNVKDYEAKILHRNKQADLAILHVYDTGKEYSALQFCNAEDLPVETNVCLLGYIFKVPNVLPLNPGVSPGQTSGLPQASAQGIKDIAFTSTGKNGTSGCPVMLGDRVMGVVHSSLNQLVQARSSETINNVLKDWLSIPQDDTRSTEEMIGMPEIYEAT